MKSVALRINEELKLLLIRVLSLELFSATSLEGGFCLTNIIERGIILVVKEVKYGHLEG